MIRFVINPLHLKSIGNMSLGNTERAAYARAAEHRRQHKAGCERTREALARARVHPATLLPLEVRIIRVSFGHVDDDAVIASAKWLRDGIAEGLGIDDGSPLIKFRYGQRHGPKGVHAVIVRIQRRKRKAS